MALGTARDRIEQAQSLAVHGGDTRRRTVTLSTDDGTTGYSTQTRNQTFK
jgi:hypothetical protein